MCSQVLSSRALWIPKLTQKDTQSSFKLTEQNQINTRYDKQKMDLVLTKLWSLGKAEQSIQDHTFVRIP